MRLEPLCSMELRYTGAFHLVRPYGGESGTGWGTGDGEVTGERLAGRVQWSNHPGRRGDGVMLPSTRGVVTTDAGAEALFELTGRTVFVERAGHEVGRQLLMALFESEAEELSWLNTLVCVAEGVIDPVRAAARFDVHVCHNDLV